MHMSHSREMKKGFTMIELLVVVSIMGILSAMGVASLRDAVVNNRVKDAAINISAYLERVASETNRLSQKVCVKVEGGKRIVALKGECSSTTKISSFELEGDFTIEQTCTAGSTSWNTSSWIIFEPKFGLSAAPVEGCIRAKYGNGEKQAMALKQKSKNNIIPQISYDNGSSGSWTGL